MKSVDIVIGANYGDEGKGLITDYCVQRSPEDSLVVRHNGGAQAGHTVITEKGRHVFSHFGSGTMRGAPTFLSEDFIVNPILFMREYNTLRKMGIQPKTYIDPSCRVTTPVDMALNYVIERVRKRSGGNHGSVGVGIFETVNRHRKDTEALTWSSIYWSQRRHIIDHLQYLMEDYVPMRLQQEGIEKDDPEALWLAEAMKDVGYRWYEDISGMRSRSAICDARILDKHKHIVFEGAQGLLLSEEYGTAPHLTPSDTGVGNALKLIGEKVNLTMWFVSRFYMTRHGAGPLEHEIARDALGVIRPCDTNVTNEFQGDFRYAPLDQNALIDRINAEQSKSNHVMPRVCLVLTCEDHLSHEQAGHVRDSFLSSSFNPGPVNATYVSNGPSAKNVRLLKEYL